MNIKNKSILLPLIFSFLIFSMLLNSMGVIILQLSTQISYKGLGFLEFFKDIPMAIVSLFCVNLISKTGNKNALTFSLIFVLLSCIALPLVDAFWFFKIWLSIVGVSFAVAKISVFSIIRNNFKDGRLSSAILRVDASFMIGIFFVNIGFGTLLTSDFAAYWKFGFWIIALLSLVTLWLLRSVRIDEESPVASRKQSAGWHYFLQPKIIYFFIIVFFIIFVEQSFNSWLPSFYRNNLHLNSYFALQASAFLALFSFFGRVLTSRLILRFHWFRLVLVCLGAVFLILMISQFLISSIDRDLQFLLVFLIPLIGLFLSPLFPLYSSEILNLVPKDKAHLLVSLVVIFSSLGSSIGSLYMAMVFHKNLSNLYPAFILLPLLFIFGLSFFLNSTTLGYDRKQKE